MIIQGVKMINTRILDGTILTNNLAIWIDANNPASYPGTGTTVTDLSGNGYNQTLSSAGIYTVLSGVKCWDCSSTGEIQDATNPTQGVVTLPTTGFTYIAWARMKPGDGNYRTLWRTWPDDHPMLTNINSSTVGMWDSSGGAFGFASSGYDAEQWTDTWAQWCVAGSSLGVAFYINGEQLGPPITTTPVGNRHWRFGNQASLQPFGYVANMFLYTRQLTQDQIQQNYFSLRSRFGV